MIYALLVFAIAALPDRDVWPPKGYRSTSQIFCIFTDTCCTFIFKEWFDRPQYDRFRAPGVAYVPVESDEAKIFDAGEFSRVAIHKCDDTRSLGRLLSDVSAPVARRTGFFMTCPLGMHVRVLKFRSDFMVDQVEQRFRLSLPLLDKALCVFNDAALQKQVTGPIPDHPDEKFMVEYHRRITPWLMQHPELAEEIVHAKHPIYRDIRDWPVEASRTLILTLESSSNR